MPEGLLVGRICALPDDRLLAREEVIGHLILDSEQPVESRRRPNHCGKFAKLRVILASSKIERVLLNRGAATRGIFPCESRLGEETLGAARSIARVHCCNKGKPVALPAERLAQRELACVE